jgi:hypothetical protein
MEHELHAIDSLRNGFGIRDVTGQEFDLVAKVCQVFAFTRIEVVEYADRVSPFDQSRGYVRTNKPRAAGD